MSSSHQGADARQLPRVASLRSPRQRLEEPLLRASLSLRTRSAPRLSQSGADRIGQRINIVQILGQARQVSPPPFRGPRISCHMKLSHPRSKAS
eukprot:4229429-Pyramimonas_sp.AAC.1